MGVSASGSGGPSSNLIGGSSSAWGNTITGSGGSGIYVVGSGTMNNLFAANSISGNTGEGVLIFGSASGNTVGGTSAGYANTITSNGSSGIIISGSGTSNNVVEGDFIGTDAADDTGLGNTGTGVEIGGGATDNTIGGTAADAGDVIVSNLIGVEIGNSGTSDNLVEGDFIGTDAAGDAGLGNTVDGVQILDNASNNTIGGSSSGAGNVIAGNGYDGVSLNGSGVSGNLVAGNIIFDNGSAGVALSSSGAGGPSSNAIGVVFLGLRQHH